MPRGVTSRRPAENWQFQTTSVESLPFTDTSFEVVLANHMLYHSAHIEVAIAEIARVLTPNGRLYAATNGIGHMRQLHERMSACGPEPADKVWTNVGNFGLENGASLLRPRFGTVRVTKRAVRLSVPAVQPVLDYVVSIQPDRKEGMRDGLDPMAALLRKDLTERGAITINTESGLLEA